MKLNEMMGPYSDRDVAPIRADLERKLNDSMDHEIDPQLINDLLQMVMQEKETSYQEGYEDGQYHKS